jgi:hypothetical protein
MIKHFINYLCGSDMLMWWPSLLLACQLLDSGTNVRLVRGSELVQDSSGFCVSFWYVFAYPEGTHTPGWWPLPQPARSLWSAMWERYRYISNTLDLGTRLKWVVILHAPAAWAENGQALGTFLSLWRTEKYFFFLDGCRTSDVPPQLVARPTELSN